MSPRRIPWRGPPLALQIVVLLLGGLVVAQLVTLFLTLLLPPAPTPQYGLGDIAAALTQGRDRDDNVLQRVVQAGPPDISGPGWLISDRSRHDLAKLMHVDERRVALAFFTPLPFAGAAAARNYAMANDGMAATPASYAVGYSLTPRLVLAQFAPMPGGGQLGPVIDGHRTWALPRDTFPPGLFPGTGRAGEAAPRGQPGGMAQTMAQIDRVRGGQPLISVDPRVATPGGIFVPGDGGAAVPPLLRGELVPQGVSSTPVTTTSAPTTGTATSTATSAANALLAREPLIARELGQIVASPLVRGGPRAALPNSSALIPQIAAAPLPDAPTRVAPPLLMPDFPAPAVHQTIDAAPRALTRIPEPSATIVPFAPATPALPQSTATAPPPEYSAPPSGPPIPIKTPSRSLFGLAPAPFVEGDFVAALRLPDGRWSVVRPAPEPFPNNWQRRVLLWFAISLALVIPLGWLFARRLVKPLDSFARAAELLGRDPSVVIGPLDGPAEIGRAAHAFNLMQGRLRAFVDDRTAMVGAISHDLRTPLTRMRFRIEDVPDDVREGLLEEVDAMEAMITQVIDYIRDASTPGARERLDLGTLVEEAVEDARLVGGKVVFERADPVPVEVDVLGLRRVLDNLLENAIKYGDCARIRLRTEAGSAIAEIIDEGPGLPDDEIERAFEPFYRSEAARSSEKSGSGLGLAVCRSIARAHGGDVRLRRSGEGFLAEMRVPLAYDAERPLAA